MNKSTAKMGSDLALLESYFSASFEGIERAAAKPVLEYLSRNIDVIEPKLERFTTEAINGLTIAYERLEQVGEILAPALAPFGDELVTVGGIVLETLKVVSDLSSYLIDTFKPAVDALGPAFGPIALALSPVLESLKILKALLEEIDALILKQRELSGLNEGVKSQIEGSTQEFNALRDRSALTPDQVKALRALGQERQEDIGKYDFEAALMVQQKMTEQLKGFAMSDDPQQQLANLEQRVHLALQSHPKLSPQTGIGVQNAIDAADAAVQGGDVNTAVEQERKALQLLGEGGQAAAVSINRLVPALDALDEHIRGIIDRATSTGPSAVAENIPPGQSSPATPAAAPGGHPGQTINIAVNFDHRDSVNQLAAKLHPVLRGIRHDLNSRFEGAAFEAAAATSMG
jgi:hypothetical protein